MTKSIEHDEAEITRIINTMALPFAVDPEILDDFAATVKQGMRDYSSHMAKRGGAAHDEKALRSITHPMLRSMVSRGEAATMCKAYAESLGCVRTSAQQGDEGGS